MICIDIGNDIIIKSRDLHFEAQISLTPLVWQTYSAFANTDGGTIVIGLSEERDGEGFDVVGIDDAEKVRNEIWSTLDDRRRVSVNILTDEDVEILEVNDRQLVAMRIQPAHRVMRPVHVGDVLDGTFERCGPDNRCCTATEIASMLRDASQEPLDLLPTRFSTLDDLDANSVEKYRKILSRNALTMKTAG